MPQESEGAAPLGQLVGRGLTWSLLGQVGTRIGSFVAGIVLARLLAPEDFGALAVALVAVNLLGACNELGVIPALVRWEGDVRAAARTGMTLAFVGSLVAYGAAFLAAPRLAVALGSPDATPVLRILALTLVVDGIVAVPQALLYRSFRQAEMVTSEALGTVAMVVASTALAGAGAGAMALAWGRLAGSVTTSALYARRQPFPGRPELHLRHARALVGFGMPLALSHLLWEGVLNVDYLVVGDILGPATLGAYLLAFNLSSWPVSIVSVAVRRVSFAAFSQLVRDRSRVGPAFGRSFGVTLTATVPLVVVIAVLAPELVTVLYGERWSAAASGVRFLVVLGGLRVVLDLMFDLLAADGRSVSTMVLRGLWLGVLVPALWVGARTEGIAGVGAAHVAVAVIVVLPALVWSLRRCGIAPEGLARQAVRPLAAGACAAGAMVLVGSLVDGSVVRLAVAGPAGVATYALVVGVRNDLIRWTWARVRVPVEPARGAV